MKTFKIKGILIIELSLNSYPIQPLFCIIMLTPYLSFQPTLLLSIKFLKKLDQTSKLYSIILISKCDCAMCDCAKEGYLPKNLPQAPQKFASKPNSF